ncbi:MAG: CoA-binding protein [Pirellulales bacterium]|nr:CoA-binding protein [Pirellulales bacterium]
MNSSKPTVAVIGASADRAKFGNKSVRAHLSQGYEVYPINLNQSQIEGLATYSSIREIPTQPVDRVTVYLPPVAAAGVMTDIAAVGCRELFLNPGSDGPEAVAAAEAAGLEPIRACSIVDIGESPAKFA